MNKNEDSVSMNDDQHLAKNIAANEAYIQKHYPRDVFISVIGQKMIIMNKYTKGLIIPTNVKVAESRFPKSPEQRSILRKELLQAEMLAKLGNSVYLIPERSAYGAKPKDAIVNGELFEFKTVTGNARTLEGEFRRAKKKGNDVNVFISVESNISKKETLRRISLVLNRHIEYSGKVVIAWGRETPCFWDSDQLK
jgi:hypothetical protein